MRFLKFVFADSSGGKKTYKLSSSHTERFKEQKFCYAAWTGFPFEVLLLLSDAPG